MLEFVSDNIFIRGNIDKFIVCGDPGCDGYNVQSVAVFESVLKAETDLLLIAGDMVPTGNEKYFKQFMEITGLKAKAPVYCLPGNHDIKDYEKYLGLKNYFIKAPNALFIMLDSSKRYFTGETLAFLSDTLDVQGSCDTFILFHIPPPNPFVDNNISYEEWEKFKIAIAKHKNHVKLIFAGHIHNVLDYRLDDFRIIITGGAGGDLDSVNSIALKETGYHFINVEFNGKEWIPAVSNIDISSIASEKIPTGDLQKGFSGESQAYRKYILFTEQAKAQGLYGIAKLFSAVASSEYIHSKNMLLASGGISNTKENLFTALQGEKSECEVLYPQFIKNAEKDSSKRGAAAFRCSLEAEKVHFKLFSEALEAMEKGEDIEMKNYYTCSRCGYTHTGDRPPGFCPGCGAGRYNLKLQ